MKVLVASDKFKGSLTAAEVAAHLRAGLHAVFPELTVGELAVADGGEGTLDAALGAGFQFIPITADGPTGRPRDTGYAVKNGVAVVELADVSGMACLPERQPAPLTASSFGTGQVLAAALEAGVHTVVLGVGGSACTDGGAGMVQALGARVLDSSGVEIGRGGAALASVAQLNLSGLHSGLADVELVLASDVDSTLHDAATVYAPQKGASPQDVERLAVALWQWDRVVTGCTGHAATDEPGSGAAGGVGYAAMALLGATMRPGTELVLELIGFDDHLNGAALVITGEGCIDEQSLRGKAPVGVATAAGRRGVPVIAVAGRSELGAASLAAAGICGVYPLTDLEPDPQECLRDAGALCEQVGAVIARDWCSGVS